MIKIIIIMFSILSNIVSVSAQDNSVVVYENSGKNYEEYVCICDFCNYQCNQWTNNSCCLEIQHKDISQNEWTYAFYVDPNIRDEERYSVWGSSCPKPIGGKRTLEESLELINSSSELFSHCGKVEARRHFSWLAVNWEVDGRCLIKGNVAYDTGEKIYHIPGWQDYETTKIDPEYGERWFCTEWQAYKAGWRAPYYTDRPESYPDLY